MSGIVGQNTLDNSGLIKSPAGGGAWNFISKQTASADATIDFTSGIDSTYREYIFTFKDIHPADDGAEFGFQTDTGTNTNYNIACTSTFFHATHREDAAVTELLYDTGSDQANGTAFQRLAYNIDNANESNFAGQMSIYSPSSTSFVKHFTGTFQYELSSTPNYSMNTFVAGYFNTTTALTRFQFKMESGNIDAGDICLYGITT